MLKSAGLGVVVLAVAGCGSGGALSQALIDQARAAGVAPDLIYVVEVPGYDLVEQSVGGVNEEGFGAFYVSPEGKQLQLRVDRGTFSDALCPDKPVSDADPSARRSGAHVMRPGGTGRPLSGTSTSLSTATRSSCWPGNSRTSIGTP